MLCAITVVRKLESFTRTKLVVCGFEAVSRAGGCRRAVESEGAAGEGAGNRTRRVDALEQESCESREAVDKRDQRGLDERLRLPIFSDGNVLEA